MVQGYKVSKKRVGKLIRMLSNFKWSDIELPADASKIIEVKAIEIWVDRGEFWMVLPKRKRDN